MLQKRLIWKVIEDNQYRNISVDQLAATLSGMIKEGNLFQNDLSAHKNAWITILVDLLKVDGSNDGEGLGLYFFDVDITDIMSQIDEEDVEAEFGEYNITKKDLETIMQVVFGVFKVTPAINSIKSTLTPDEKMEALEYRRFDNYVKVSQQCCDENTSCYNCLRNYYNQTNHSKLKRKYARDFIESLLRQIGVRP